MYPSKQLSPESLNQNGTKTRCKIARTLVTLKHRLTHDSAPMTACYDREQVDVGNMS